MEPFSLTEMLAKGEPLPEGDDFKGKFIYYVGPVDPVGDEVLLVLPVLPPPPHG